MHKEAEGAGETLEDSAREGTQSLNTQRVDREVEAREDPIKPKAEGRVTGVLEIQAEERKGDYWTQQDQDEKGH